MSIDQVFGAMVKNLRSDISSAFSWVGKHEDHSDSASLLCASNAIFRMNGSYKMLSIYCEYMILQIPIAISKQFHLANGAFEAATNESAPQTV